MFYKRFFSLLVRREFTAVKSCFLFSIVEDIPYPVYTPLYNLLVERYYKVH